MTLNPATYSTRSVSMVMLAVFAATALWLFAPWGGGHGAGSGGGNAGAALPPSLKLDGQVQVQTQGNVVTRLVVPLTVRGTQGILLTDDSGNMRAETLMSATAAAAVPAHYTVTWLNGNGDHVLDPGERAILTVDLPAHSSVHPGNPLDLVIYPAAGGGTLKIENVLGN
ncbi:MAG TPA: hypothetical protein VEZ14_14525 [Dehalococcoidia bacterium]|nr:hypothetical protein [Dehalococcoidia bacterium]